MTIRIAVLKERTTHENRVALVPDVAARLCKLGFEIFVERGAGAGSFFPDTMYEQAGAQLGKDADELLTQTQILLKVGPLADDEISLLKEGAVVIGFMHAHRNPMLIERLRAKKITAFAMEKMPRVTRAQSMDALSSQATVAGYKAVLLAASLCPRFFPMLTTAAGTIRPAKVLVLGAGVAGLMAIATARRLGGVVEAYDVRGAVKEQVESLGARFLAIAIDAAAAGGYARELTVEEKKAEQEMLAAHLATADVVITTAQIPGKTAPRLISEEMLDRMKTGAVVVDMAAESGGNCALSRAGETVEHGGVRICGPINLPSQLPVHASEMVSKNIFNFLMLLTKEGKTLEPDWNDEIISGAKL